MKRREDTRNELKESAPVLSERASTNPFVVPDNYFNALPYAVLQCVKTEPKQIALPPTRWKEVLSVAAVVAALFILGLTLLRDSSIRTASTNLFHTNVTIERVSSDELFDYLQVDLNNIPVEAITAHVSDASLDTLENEWLASGMSTPYDDALLDLSGLDAELLESL